RQAVSFRVTLPLNRNGYQESVSAACTPYMPLGAAVAGKGHGRRWQGGELYTGICYYGTSLNSLSFRVCRCAFTGGDILMFNRRLATGRACRLPERDIRG